GNAEEEAVPVGREAWLAGGHDRHAEFTPGPDRDDGGLHVAVSEWVGQGENGCIGRVAGEVRFQRLADRPPPLRVARTRAGDLDRVIALWPLEPEVDKVGVEDFHQNVGQAFRNLVTIRPGPDGGKSRQGSQVAKIALQVSVVSGLNATRVHAPTPRATLTQATGAGTGPDGRPDVRATPGAVRRAARKKGSHARCRRRSLPDGSGGRRSPNWR